MFAEDLPFSEDVDWFLSALEQNIKLSIVREPALVYRLHSDCVTHQEGLDCMHCNFLKALRRSIVRRSHPDTGHFRNREAPTTVYGYLDELGWVGLIERNEADTEAQS